MSGKLRRQFRTRALEQPVVLIVHQDRDTREMYAEFLRRHRIVVLTHERAEEALRVATLADAIVTDLRLPGTMDGLQLIARVRADDRTAEATIIVLTASVFSRDRAAAAAAGADTFLPMPCLPHDLLKHLHSSLAPPSAATRRHGNREDAHAAPEKRTA